MLNMVTESLEEFVERTAEEVSKGARTVIRNEKSEAVAVIVNSR